ncbi:hypothetical protein N1030_14525 [Desulfovibrio mangrovi]|uniref:nickel/cobalt transporter n=1 Tax=Desulfovibrio mangrovi TaxID=2976983 RepID=UPI0022473852|nr:hypothetical protein [Desulfovibrio mangrovi]UZP66812.1 hypothetical protein N1030_14525 [Desulfovibrio mangrovi]
MRIQRLTFYCAAACVALLMLVFPVAPAVDGSTAGGLGFVTAAEANPFTKGARARGAEASAEQGGVARVHANATAMPPQAGSIQPVSPHGAVPAVPSSSAELSGGEAPARDAGFFAMPYTRMLRTITAVQKELRQKLSELGRDIADNPGGESFWLFMGLSFFYGVVHALGPGHGKAVVFSYFLGKRGSVARGFAMGHLLSFVHAFSAVVLVFVLQWLMGRPDSQGFDEARGVLQHVSYGLVAAIGLIMLVHAVYETVSGRQAARVCYASAPQAGYGGIAAVSLLAGLVPCPGAALVLAFALSLGLPWTGLFAVLALAVGMGLTTSLFGVLSIVSRSALVHVAGRGPRLLSVAYSMLAIAGALGITLLGTMLFLTVKC